MSGEEAVCLTSIEASCLARRIIADHLRDWREDAWADWEMVPELSEASYELLGVFLDLAAKEAERTADRRDRRNLVDSRDLRGEVA